MNDQTSLEERPIATLEELLDIYEFDTSDLEKAKSKAKEELQFVKTLFQLKDEIEETFDKKTELGRVYGITAPWGTGKTSFVNILVNELKESKQINLDNLCIFKYEALFYGNVSDAISVFIGSLFKKIESQYSIRLKGIAEKLAKNLSPQLEITGLFPKLSILRNNNRLSTELILTNKVKNKLRDINGKILIIIDDIDRLTSEEALHFLRLTRVLKELPNTYVILPIATDSLVELLNKENISNPSGYINKLISYRKLEFSMAEASTYFKKKMSLIQDAKEGNIEDLWLAYLWEVCLKTVKKYESQIIGNDPMNFSMSAGSQDQVWQLFDDISDDGDNIVRALLTRVTSAYGAPKTLYTRYREGANDSFRSIPDFVGGISFSAFYDGRYPVPGNQNRGKDIFSLRVYDCEEQLTQRAQESPGVDKFNNIDKSFVDSLTQEILWDRVKDIPLDPKVFPTKCKALLGARMLKILIERLGSDNEIKNDLVNLERSQTTNIYKKYKLKIREIVSDNFGFTEI